MRLEEVLDETDDVDPAALDVLVLTDWLLELEDAGRLDVDPALLDVEMTRLDELDRTG